MFDGYATCSNLTCPYNCIFRCNNLREPELCPYNKKEDDANE